MNQTNKILARVEKIAPLPQTVARLMQLVNEPDHGAGDVANVVSTDPVLTAHVLRVVNSAAFGLGQAVGSLDRAVAYLGDKIVLGIAIGSGASEVFGARLEGYEAEQGMLWRHSLCAAIAARELLPLVPAAGTPASAFTAGLLHDIGKTVVSEYLKGRKTDPETRAEFQKDFVQFERDQLGTDHAEVGSLLAQRWRFPASMSEVIRWHHEPGRASPEQRPLAYLLHLADVVAVMAGMGTGVDAFCCPIDSTYQQYVPIQSPDLEKIILRVAAEFERMSDSIFSKGTRT